MTNTTLREEFDKKFPRLHFTINKSPWDWTERVGFSYPEPLLDFIQSKMKEAREEMARFISSEMYHWDQIASEKLDHVLKRAINSLK